MTGNGEKTNPLPPHRTRLRVAVALLVFIVLFAVGAFFLAFHPTKPVKPPPPPPVAKKIETVQAQTGVILQTVNAPGKLTITHYSDVGTQIPGLVKELYVNIGDSVKEGKLLAEISPVTEAARAENNRAQLTRLNAELADQSAQLEFAQLQFQRQTRLKQDKATRDEDVESTRMNVLSNTAKMDAIRAQIQQVNASIKDDEALQRQTRIVAPMSGTVVTLSIHKGQLLNNAQSTLLRIADLSKMTMQARVDEKDITRLHKGMTAYFTTPGFPGKRWSGKLSQIMPLPLEENTQPGKQSFYIVLFDVPNPGQELMSGMNGEVEFVLAQAENTVIIPASAFHDLPDGGKGASEQILHVMERNGSVSERKVTIGLKNKQQVQVISGLEAGEHIVMENKAPSSAAAPAVSVPNDKIPDHQ